MNSALNKSLNFLEKVINYIVAILMVVITLVIFYQVLQRFVFGNPTVWSEELARYGFVWSVFLASAVAIRRSRHIRIDFVVQKLPGKWKLITEIFSYILMLVFLAFLFREGWAVMDLSIKLNQESAGLKLLMAYPYAAIPVGTILMCLFVLEMMVKSINDHLKKNIGT